jgi:hypothetical protein
VTPGREGAAVDEAKWLAGTDPTPMLGFLLRQGTATPRKCRLFACACCRRLWNRLRDPRSRRAVAAAEAYADGHISQADLKRAWNEGARAHRSTQGHPPAPRAATLAAHPSLASVLTGVNSAAYGAGSWQTAGWKVERAAQAVLLRDLFGNPFRPLTIDPAWRTAEVVRLAQAVYQERAFDRFPILADLLEEAGATAAALLGHLRGPGPHARGCHVLDAMLEKG